MSVDIATRPAGNDPMEDDFSRVQAALFRCQVTPVCCEPAGSRRPELPSTQILHARAARLCILGSPREVAGWPEPWNPAGGEIPAMKVLIFCGTGSAGGSVLRVCLAAPD